MTPLDLHESLESTLKVLFSEVKLESGKSINIYKQDIPLELNEETTSKAPLIVISMTSGKILEDEGLLTQEVYIRFELLVKEADTELTGYKDIMMMIQKIMYHLVENRTIANIYEVAMPISYDLIQTEEFGIFLGIMDATFNSPLYIERKEAFNVL